MRIGPTRTTFLIVPCGGKCIVCSHTANGSFVANTIVSSGVQLVPQKVAALARTAVKRTLAGALPSTFGVLRVLNCGR